PPVPVPPPPPPASTDGPDEDDWRAPASYGPTGANSTYGSSRPGPYGSPEPEPTTPLPTIRPQDR
ncbi:hypothetical protein HC023_35290, partial [Streptomyces sp. NEAU-H3]|nr:hypothetical protein [Streptomyces sp. NEAU-H3]